MQNDPEPMIQLDQPLPDANGDTSLDRIDHTIADLRRLFLGEAAASPNTDPNAPHRHLHGHHAKSPKGPHA